VLGEACRSDQALIDLIPAGEQHLFDARPGGAPCCYADGTADWQRGQPACRVRVLGRLTEPAASLV